MRAALAVQKRNLQLGEWLAAHGALTMLAVFGLVYLLCAACTEDRSTRTVDGSVPPLDAGAEHDAGALADAAHDGVAATQDGAEADPELTCPVPADSSEVSALELEAPSSLPPDAPFMLAVRSTPAVDTRVQVCIDGQPLAEVQLYRGRGSVSTTLARRGSVTVRLAARGAALERTLQVEARPRNEVSGTLAAAEVVWSSEQDHVLSGRVVLPAGGSLRIEAGARILLEQRAALEIQGELRAAGSAERPVLFSRAGAAAWSELRLTNGASAELDHTWFTGGGGDHALTFGHSESAPVIGMKGATLVMRGGGLLDNPGKAFGTAEGAVTLEDVLVTRCDTGGEFAATHLSVRRSHVLEIPDADGSIDDDDNDAIYLLGDGHDAEGKVVESVIEDSVFARGEDDGIDHNLSLVRIERVWVEGFAHECVAGSSGSQLTIVDSVIRGCEQGVEAGYGSPRVVVEHSVITGNRVGLRYGDTYDKTSKGTLEVTGSVISGNVEATKNYVGSLDGPRPDAIQIRCSIISDTDFSQRDGNRPPLDETAWQPGTCLEAEPAADGCENAGPRTRTCF